MVTYIIKRILLFIPTLLLVSCLIFYLSKRVPSDPVENMLSLQGMEASYSNYNEEYEKIYVEKGLNKPEFYFSIKPSYEVAPSFKLEGKFERSFYDRMLIQRIPFKYIEEFILLTRALDRKTKSKLLVSKNRMMMLAVANNLEVQPEYQSGLNKAIDYLSNTEVTKPSWHYPVLSWHGLDNQYHKWLISMLNGNWGISFTDSRPVVGKIWGALKWTLMLVFSSLSIAILLSFPLGIYFGMNAGNSKERWMSNVLFAFYAIPKFWLATIFIIFFTTSEYGVWTNIFPSVGMWDISTDGSFLATIWNSKEMLILPIIVIIIPDIAYLSRLIRAGVQEEVSKEYIKTAFSKGLSTKDIAKKHIVPNALTPTITLLSGVIPKAIASSLVIEVIFNIPGIGRLLFSSIHTSDWTVVYPIVLLISVVTVISYLLADILIAWLNPKVEF